MSFEGFYQVVCQKGHYHEVNCYDFSFRSWRCPDCQSMQSLAELVDQTNDKGEKKDPGKLIEEALKRSKD